MKKKILIGIVGALCGFLAGVAVEYFVWDIPLNKSVPSLLTASVTVSVILSLGNRIDSKKKAQS